eukprot:CAMPEP_0116872612 /NCGR_PEP_ID=MMETSP0463-20121206/3398_1 /TAXON_ID=181622 /ORGANISM="Strombidinopsis sp, Strain SopsisLIS2011" /LENGTH=56 /DNA_ID=CAMNT_0004513079 /DNA_START=286 /DNA_END=456 /DNA_ORIENTATION=-
MEDKSQFGNLPLINTLRQSDIGGGLISDSIKKSRMSENHQSTHNSGEPPSFYEEDQ